MTAHSAVLQAAGRDAAQVEGIAEGTLGATALDPGERAIEALVRKSVVAPARLVPEDLAGVAAAYGPSGAIEIAAVLASFHFINRIADLVGIQSDLPIVQPRWRALRNLGVRVQAWGMRRLFDLSNQPVTIDADAALAEAEAALGPRPAGYAAIRDVPNVAGFLTTVAAVVRRLDPGMVARVARTVTDALPSCEEEATGFHARPPDPLDALAFVGTRYVVRTTDAMVDAVRRQHGLDDAELTDLFYAIGMRNAFERFDRLLAR